MKAKLGRPRSLFDQRGRLRESQSDSQPSSTARRGEDTANNLDMSRDSIEIDPRGGNDASGIMSGATSSKRYAAIMGSEHPVHQSGGRELNADTSGTAAIERDDAHRMTPVHFSSRAGSGRGQSRLNESRSLPISPLCRLSTTTKYGLCQQICQRQPAKLRVSAFVSLRFRPLLFGCWWFHSIWGTCLDVADEHHQLRRRVSAGPSCVIHIPAAQISPRGERDAEAAAGIVRAGEGEASRPQRQRPPHVSGDDIERTLQHLDAASKGLKSAGIQAFLTQIHGIVSGMHKQLNDAHSEIQELSARNAVLQACLDRALHDRVVLRSNQDNDALLLDVATSGHTAGGRSAGRVGGRRERGVPVHRAKRPSTRTEREHVSMSTCTTARIARSIFNH